MSQKVIDDILAAINSAGVTGVNVFVIIPPEEKKEEKEEFGPVDFTDFQGIFGGGAGVGGGEPGGDIGALLLE